MRGWAVASAELLGNATAATDCDFSTFGGKSLASGFRDRHCGHRDHLSTDPHFFRSRVLTARRLTIRLLKKPPDKLERI